MINSEKWEIATTASVIFLQFMHPFKLKVICTSNIFDFAVILHSPFIYNLFHATGLFLYLLEIGFLIF